LARCQFFAVILSATKDPRISLLPLLLAFAFLVVIPEGDLLFAVALGLC